VEAQFPNEIRSLIETHVDAFNTQNAVRTGTLAYVFAKNAGEWKIEAQAWGRTS
jgi:hypothetical protein